MKFFSLVIILFALFAPNTVEAQTAVSSLCFNESAKSLSWPVNNACTAPLVKISASGVTNRSTDVCLVKKTNSTTYQVFAADLDLFGKASCKKYSDDTSTYSEVKLTTISGTPPGGTPPNPNPNPNPNPTPAPAPPTQGTCPDGFVQKGPLCIPDNPFGNSGGIAGKGTVGELATTIISILLFLSGMIAVIMLIIGGYTWMTARGNEAQALNARKTVINALIGLVIIVLAYAIVQAVTNLITKGT